jgi:hypothetical protein
MTRKRFYPRIEIGLRQGFLTPRVGAGFLHPPSGETSLRDVMPRFLPVKPWVETHG